MRSNYDIRLDELGWTWLQSLALSRTNLSPSAGSEPAAAKGSIVHLQGGGGSTAEPCFKCPKSRSLSGQRYSLAWPWQVEQWLSELDVSGPVTLGLVRRYRSDPVAEAQGQRLKSRNKFTFDSLGSRLMQHHRRWDVDPDCTQLIEAAAHTVPPRLRHNVSFGSA